MARGEAAIAGGMVRAGDCGVLRFGQREPVRIRRKLCHGASDVTVWNGLARVDVYELPSTVEEHRAQRGVKGRCGRKQGSVVLRAVVRPVQ